MNQERLEERSRLRFKRNIGNVTFWGLLAALCVFTGYNSVKHSIQEGRQKAEQAQKDKKTSAVLIEKKESVTTTGYAGLMFFDTDGQTNTAEAVVHFVTRTPEKMEKMRRLKTGDMRRVSDWKNLFFEESQPYTNVKNWIELKRE